MPYNLKKLYAIHFYAGAGWDVGKIAEPNCGDGLRQIPRPNG